MKKQLLSVAMLCISSTAIFAQGLPAMFDPVRELVASKLPATSKILFGGGANAQSEIINGNWRNKDTTVGTMDAQGNQTRFYQQKWDTVTNMWAAAETDLVQQFTYDGSQKITGMKRTIKSNGQLVLWSTATFNYDGGGNRMPTTSFDSIMQGTTPIGFMGVDSFVYTSGKISERILLRKIGPITQMSERFTYTYNGSGKMTEMLRQKYQSSAWENDVKETYNYDANGNLSMFMVEEYDNGTSAWMKDKIDSFYYNSSSVETGHREYKWDAATTNWRGDESQSYVYAGTPQRISEVFSEEWNSTTMQWVKKDHAMAYYNGSGLPTHVYIYKWLGTAYETNYSKKIVWGAGGSVGLKSVEVNKSMTIYPNPTKNAFSVSVDNLNGEITYKVIDVMGRQVASGSKAAQASVVAFENLNLNGGIYHVIIENNNKTYQSKLVVE